MRLIASMTRLGDMSFVHSKARCVPLCFGHHMKSWWSKSYLVSFQHPWHACLQMTL